MRPSFVVPVVTRKKTILNEGQCKTDLYIYLYNYNWTNLLDIIFCYIMIVDQIYNVIKKFFNFNFKYKIRY